VRLQTFKTKGVKIESMPPNLEREFTRLGERFSRERIREAGALFTTFFLKLPSSTLDASTPTAMAEHSVTPSLVLAKR
jgi:hypothetical protein